ncbi:hypothetical protein ACNTMW_19605 [Planosporangium sp. 12N6]|uniref:hypothetical protein n=1 Tax=Planosporangium spinosum TaxID=3402278 RepID=UPI003CEAB86C
MVALVGALMVGLLVVGTAALSGHPLPMIVVALVVGCVIVAIMWRVRTLAESRSVDAPNGRRR